MLRGPHVARVLYIRHLWRRMTDTSDNLPAIKTKSKAYLLRKGLLTAFGWTIYLSPQGVHVTYPWLRISELKDSASLARW